MKNYLTLLLTLLTFNLSAQTLLNPYSIETGGKKLWGYKDSLGKVITEPKYTQCPYFYTFQQFVMVDIGGKKGIINRTGKEITPIKYDGAYPDPVNGLMIVYIKYIYGFVDTTGKEAIPLIYNQVKEFDSERAWVKQGDKKWFIDTKGNTVIDLSAFEETHDQFGNGLCGVKQGGRWGYMDVSGKIVIPCKYDNVHRMTEGLGIVVSGGKPDEYGQFKGGKWGFIDKTGKEVTPLKYDFAQSFVDEIAVVNSGGELTIYESAWGGKWGYIDKTGKEITSLKYNNAQSSSEGMAVVNINGKWAYDGMGGYSLKGGEWGYIDTKGNEAIPLQYEEARSFILGEATVTKEGKSFNINKKGENITPETPAYDGGSGGDYDYEDY
jgi:hypothetical protein